MGGGGSVGWRILKLLVVLLLLPACVGLTLGVRDHFLSVWPQLDWAVFAPSTLLKWFFCGAAGFILFSILLWRPKNLYVFNHELVHHLAGWLSPGTEAGAEASPTDAADALAPVGKLGAFIHLGSYCVPLSALLAAGLYLILDAWWRSLGAYVQWFACALGCCYGFHLEFMLWSQHRNQPDLKSDGWLFMLVLSYIGNAVIFVLLLGFLAEGHGHGAWTALRDCAQLSTRHASEIYLNLGTQARQLFNP